MAYKSKIGEIGENIACKYLINKKYKIIERNHRQKWGELDIIAKDPDKTIVFVEVKAIRQNNSAVAGLKPEDNLTTAKLRKLQRTAQLFAGKYQNLLNDNKGWRIDLIAVTMFYGQHPQINHYENIG